MMKSYVTTVALTLIAGGAAGALITLFFFNLPRRFWSRYSELQRVVFDNPFLYPIWDQAGEPHAMDRIEKWKSSYTDWSTAVEYMRPLSPLQQYQVLTFVELWGDFVIESHTLPFRVAMGRHFSGLTDRAKDLAIAYDLFPGNRKARCIVLGRSEAAVPQGRNGNWYGIRSLRILDLWKR